MSTTKTGLNLSKVRGYVDLNLLLFLLLFLNVKLAVKILAIILIYILQFSFKFGFSFKNSRLPLFYLLIIIIPFIDVLINRDYTNTNYLIALLLGTGFWLLCILAAHQVKLSVERNDTEVIHRTLVVFFTINAVVSLLNLTVIIFKTGVLNPYIYQGEYQKYFLNTGDFIRGFTFDTSTTNAILNGFAVIYFLARKNAAMMLLCMIALLLTASNFTNMIMLVILLPTFIFWSTRDQKSLIAICFIFFITFMVKISPQNNKYVINTFKTMAHIKLPKVVPSITPVPLTKRPDSELNPEERKDKAIMLYLDSIGLANAKGLHSVQYKLPEKVFVEDNGRISIPKPNIHTTHYQWGKTTLPEQKQLVTFVNAHNAELSVSPQGNVSRVLPGKVTGFLQTINFLCQHPAKILTGDGIGNFSSKLAFKTTGLGISGKYPEKYIYINKDFEINHLDLYLNFFSKAVNYHSLINSPFSVYDQLLSEYGILGLLALFVCYLWFFAKHYKHITYGLPILLFVGMVFFIDYWFEQLSVLIVFELLLFLNIKETKKLAYA